MLDAYGATDSLPPNKTNLVIFFVFLFFVLLPNIHYFDLSRCWKCIILFSFSPRHYHYIFILNYARDNFWHNFIPQLIKWLVRVYLHMPTDIPLSITTYHMTSCDTKLCLQHISFILLLHIYLGLTRQVFHSIYWYRCGHKNTFSDFRSILIMCDKKSVGYYF